MKLLFISAFYIFICCTVGCDNTMQCERHYIPKGYMGKVVIYYNQKNGEKKVDKNGCIVKMISNKGECFSA